MKGPEYTELSNSDGCVCSLCGVVVVNQRAHTDRHAALARILGLEVDE